MLRPVITLTGGWLLTMTAFAADPPPKPDPAVVKALRSVGGNVMEIAQTDSRLDVTLHLADQDVTDDHLRLVAQLPNVAWLNLAGTKITDEGLAVLKTLEGLEKLHLERTGIGDAGLAHLTGLKKLVYLNVYGTKVTDEGLKHLEGLANLRRLYVWQSQVTPEGIARLKEKLPELTIIGELSLQPAPAPQEESKTKKEE
jgi:hypothetical protein